MLHKLENRRVFGQFDPLLGEVVSDVGIYTFGIGEENRAVTIDHQISHEDRVVIDIARTEVEQPRNFCEFAHNKVSFLFILFLRTTKSIEFFACRLRYIFFRLTIKR